MPHFKLPREGNFSNDANERQVRHRYFTTSLRPETEFLPTTSQNATNGQKKVSNVNWAIALFAALLRLLWGEHEHNKYSCNTRNAHLTKFLAARSKLSVQEEKEEETVCTCHCRPRSTTDVGVSSVVHGVASSPKVPRGHSLTRPTSHSPFLPSISSLPHCLALVNVMFPKDY